ncbi:hypothetical protein BDV35DRAFT_351387 [Aspergillus flavus]|uniref:Unnamed protein product n=3 Tax=Aspergillus subgen. Circumdati TaxID=2720871 RepID=A0AAN4YP70_ASPOZ|nr:hypothetical protein BDV35DRAFT_351387 [Aspergillus flavus]GMF70452.1 unnamed protein product [Aspergillus oryzae]GMG51516.1 unnamed protein product [Aspergillus oryzae var. brunneus]GMF89453.1 unnamed protein product [Aspergillus oryzae]GMG08616.1 unnamed protein product [Aspergillus oryzae]
MGPQLFLIVGLFLQLLSAHELHPRAGPDCQFSVAASYLGETCDTFTRRWHIDRATFLSLNPGADCSGLADDRTYCVQPSPSVSATSMATTSSTTTATSTAAMSTTTDISTVTSSTSTSSSTATSSTSTGGSTATSSTTADSSTATTESATPTASSESSATSSTVPLQITMILTLLLSLCFI